MDRRSQRAKMPAMGAIRPPPAGLPRGSSQQQHMPVPPGFPMDGIKQDPPRLGWGRIMAKDNARPARQGANGRDQAVAQPFVGHQPDLGQAVVAL